MHRSKIRKPDLRLAFAVFRRYQPYLAAWFLAMDLGYNHLLARPVGIDAALYTAAAHAWLAGGDPWLVLNAGTRFAAPPPTLVLYVPFTLLPSSAVIVVGLILNALAILVVIQRLRLAWWWVLFPPLFTGALNGNPEPVLLAALVASNPMIAALAPTRKPYAVAALLGERRWLPIAIAGLLVLVTAPILPWGRFVQDAPLWSATLADQAAGLSAFSVPWLVPAGILGLLGLGGRRAGWLTVPVLFPNTQLHYATIALPAITPILAFGLSLPVPGAPAIAVATQWLVERWRPSNRRDSSRPGVA
jgi:hypothetical protein